jgi:hypothetical protein
MADWKNVCSDSWPVFNWVPCFIELKSPLFILDMSLYRYIIYRKFSLIPWAVFIPSWCPLKYKIFHSVLLLLGLSQSHHRA